MKVIYKLFIGGLAMSLFACSPTEQTTTTNSVTSLEQSSTIPIPNSVTSEGGVFVLNKTSKIVINGNAQKTKEAVQAIKENFSASIGSYFNVEENVTPSKGDIVLQITDTIKGEEEYQVEINNKNIIVSAATSNGLFYGVQTIRQLLPGQIESNEVVGNISWEIPAGKIIDSPRFGYRGFMLDVSRHFYTVEEVKQFIDHMAMYKMNKLHLHLTDDQGWRIEIKSWPDLTIKGSISEVGGTDGGFYTQKQYKDLVKYAQERFVTIIPEFDLPGHTQAAIHSYPELVKKPFGKLGHEYYTGTEVGESSLDVNNPLTYKFMDDVIGELAAITPGAYIHIGGDETHVTKKEDFVKFITKVRKIVSKHGKEMIGWADISDAELEKNNVAQFWKTDARNAKLAAKQGVKMLMSPANVAYLDIKYTKEDTLGLDWAGIIEVDEGYNWDPAKFLNEIPVENIIGIESPLWGETVKTMDDAEWLVFPRLIGYAEIGWSQQEKRDWNTYKVRLAGQQDRLETLGINFYKSPKVPWIDAKQVNI